ncbi:hypothetical protein N7G274_000148 [Stereocaulon virgatum]|uniref:Uncharacterized protein n=1 Tax=Stereocaulon virgatum TaxID=373712 RepID=A0ABR4ARA6_9LECA
MSIYVYFHIFNLSSAGHAVLLAQIVIISYHHPAIRVSFLGTYQVDEASFFVPCHLRKCHLTTLRFSCILLKQLQSHLISMSRRLIYGAIPSAVNEDKFLTQDTSRNPHKANKPF